MVEKKKDTIIREKPEVIERREREDILVKEKPVVKEVHEKPVIDIHEREQERVVKHDTQYKHERAAPVHEHVTEEGREEELRRAREKAGQGYATREVKEPSTVRTTTEQPSITEMEKRQREVHEKPLIREVHEKPVVVEREQPIEKTVYEKPEVRVHRETLEGGSTVAGGEASQKAQEAEQKGEGVLGKTLGKIGGVVESIVNPQSSSEKK